MQLIKTKAKDLGDDFTVRRALPSKSRQMIGPFIFWDHMGPVKLKENDQMLVRQHPHIGLATLTFLFSGNILHRDSLNNECLIKPGEINWMTAGRGITHSERSRGTDVLEGIQLWVALPREHENTDPSFKHYDKEDLPKLRHDNVELTLIAGKYKDLSSPVKTYSPLFYLNGKAEKNSSIQLDFSPDHEIGVYIASGQLEINDAQYEEGDLIYFSPSQNKINLTASSKANFMLLGGEPFKEKRHIWWNFVSSSKESIELAKKRWKNQTFEKTFNEPEEVFIPLPTS